MEVTLEPYESWISLIVKYFVLPGTVCELADPLINVYNSKLGM